ncbi:probable serine/threonine-protein kinase pats1 [Ostrea edulis]|uniref:probable serine/threonine-protein kinase pats1 n=1 Tax=Ostrea edulis TaxID=37623 RepID=UPI0024AEE7E7|nr:probable serine/threonine-protein kinase pats1 [Ostrea edulis]
MTDFAGQVAYYACHQIYLSRRAFYLLVIDMSKKLKDIAYDPERHNPIGSLFEKWTYEHYFVFWLQSIKTYCDDKKMKEKFGDRAGVNPVILIATHRDQLETENVRKPENPANSSMIEYPFYEELEKCLPKEQTLGGLISPERYFEVECPPRSLSKEQEDSIDEVRKCIVQTATGLPHWGEKIPTQWSYFEQIAYEKKKEKILKRNDLWDMDRIQFSDENDMDDMLRFYQEIGQIIYFSDKRLRDVIILDVQWFVDAFKAIITDPTHVRHFTERTKEWKDFEETGKLSDATLIRMWEKINGGFYIKYKDEIMPYMEKLGILANVKSQEEKRTSYKKNENTFYYIPSINKKDLKDEHKQIIDEGNKTPLFIFYFRNYLPHFFSYRLFVNCFRKWESLRDDLFFKNAAFYSGEGGDHNIVIAVSKTSIQLQVFTLAKNIKLEEEETKSIRSVVEEMINEITTTFHEQVDCEKGFACKDLKITEEDEDMFLREEAVSRLKTNKRPCPKHVLKSERHDIDRDSLLKYWY